MHLDSAPGRGDVKPYRRQPSDCQANTCGNLTVVHILLGTDAQWVLDEVVAALGTPETSFTVCRNGRDVPEAIRRRVPDLAILDLQFGTMGAMAVTMDLRLDHSDHRIPHVPVVMLLDRVADVHLARRSGAEGWVVKPLDALKLQQAARAVLAGDTWHDGPVSTGSSDAIAR